MGSASVAATSTSMSAGRSRTALAHAGIGIGALVVLLSIWLPWYATDPAFPGSQVNNLTGKVTAWDAHEVFRILLLIVVAHAVLHFALLRAELSWPRGSGAMKGAVDALGIVLLLGLIDRPGEPMSTISLTYGWWVALAGGLIWLMGSLALLRGSTVRRPPGL